MNDVPGRLQRSPDRQVAAEPNLRNDRPGSRAGRPGQIGAGEGIKAAAAPEIQQTQTASC